MTSPDVRETAIEEIISACGGLGNILRADCCATRLRLSLADPGGADAELLRSIDGVAGVLECTAAWHVVLGIHAPEYYELLSARMKKKERPPDADALV